ncbi:porin family protein [Leadbetterella sp. DM7]|uniref:porin family protein n=1 Tax=Leadbetterella sp. DM7 TaxID=3235085 RepID=UPI00349EA533
MKKILALFIFLCFVISSINAQTIRAKGGLNVNTISLRSPYGNESITAHIGFHLGGTIDIPIYEKLSIESGLLVSQKGFREVYSEEEFRYSPVYLDIPTVGKYKYELNNTFSVYGTLGIYLGFGIGGFTRKIDTFQGINSYKKPIIWGSHYNADFKAADAGIILGGGIEFNVFQVGISHTIGVANISPYSMAGYNLANRVFSLSLGYKLSESN